MAEPTPLAQAKEFLANLGGKRQQAADKALLDEAEALLAALVAQLEAPAVEPPTATGGTQQSPD